MIQYCILLWANSYYSHLHKLRLLQKKAIRIISNTDYRTHSSKLFLKLNLLKLDDIMTFQLGTFMYKLKNNKLPSMIPHMFITNENIHSHNTRNKEGYLIPSVRTNCRKLTVSYAGPNPVPIHASCQCVCTPFFSRHDRRTVTKYCIHIRIDMGLIRT